MTVVGGIRSRLIVDSFYRAFQDGLGQLGWFDPGRQHLPINLLAGPVDNLQEIPLNTVAVSDEGLTEYDVELGSTAVETTQVFYIDFYAESDVLGRHLINDVRDFLGGRLPTIGRTDPSLVVYDYRLATPAPVFIVQIEGIMVDRAHAFPKPWQQHWYSCSFVVRDAYG